MVATQSYDGVLNMVYLMPLWEQKQLIKDIQKKLDEDSCESSITREDLIARVELADKHIDEGLCKSHADAISHFEARINQKRAAL